MGRNRLRGYAAEIPESGPAVDGRVTVQEFFPIPAVRDTDAIVQSWNRRKVTDDGDVLSRSAAMA